MVGSVAPRKSVETLKCHYPVSRLPTPLYNVVNSSVKMPLMVSLTVGTATCQTLLQSCLILPTGPSAWKHDVIHKIGIHNVLQRREKRQHAQKFEVHIYGFWVML